MVRFSFFSSCFMRPIAAVYLAAVSLCASSLRVLLCSASITCASQWRSQHQQAVRHTLPGPTPSLTLWVAWFSISCQAESNCRLSSSRSLCSASEMVSLAARSTSVALWKSWVAFWASSWA